jgi:hypothetical protein
MLTQYEVEAFVKDYQTMRMQQREEAMKLMLIQPQPRRPSRLKFRLPRFILKWLEREACAEPLQECPELA